jgi:MFS family permease
VSSPLSHGTHTDVDGPETSKPSGRTACDLIVSRPADERLFGGHSGRILWSLALAWATLQTGRFLLSPLLPTIIDALSITTVTAGLALGGLQLAYALTQYPSGRISDSSSRAALVLPGIGVSIGAFLLVAVTSTYGMFVVATLLVGAGKGLFAIPSRALLSDLFVDRRGQALGIYTAGTDGGGLLAAGIAFVIVGGAAVLTTVTPTWRLPFGVIAAALIASGLLYLVWNHEPLRIDRPPVALVRTLRRLFATRRQRGLLLAFSLFYFTIGAWINFLPTYLSDAKELSAPLPQLLFAVVFAVGIAIKPVAGALSDRIPRRLVAVTGLTLAAGALGLVIIARSVITIAAAIGLFAVGYKTQFPIIDALVLDTAPDDNLGGDLGAARTFFLAIGALGPVYMGTAAATVGYDRALGGLALCLVVTAAVLRRDMR